MSVARNLHVLLLATLFVASASAQEPEEKQGEEPVAVFDGLVEVSEVFLDVLVTDADGGVVEGLGMDDFVIEENGAPISATTLSYYTTRYEEGAASGDEIPWSRHFIFVFHTPWSLSFARADMLRQRVRAGQSALRWVEEENVALRLDRGGEPGK